MLPLLLYFTMMASTGAVLLRLGTFGPAHVVVTVVAVAMGASVVTAVEHRWPAVASWRPASATSRVDAMHMAVNIATVIGSMLLFAWAHSMLGAPAELWPTSWPIAARLGLALVIIDLGLYSVHRASHTVGWLWRLHAIHHTSEQIVSLNAHRRHVVHEVLEGAPGLVCLSLLGASPDIVASAMALVAVHLLFQHANVRLKLGPLGYLLALAPAHRWHHQREYEAAQGNYGAVFSVWDHLLGTALSPGEGPPEVGLDEDPPVPHGWLAQHRWPFETGNRPR